MVAAERDKGTRRLIVTRDRPTRQPPGSADSAATFQAFLARRRRLRPRPNGTLPASMPAALTPGAPQPPGSQRGARPPNALHRAASAGVLAVLAIAACSTDTIDLLPRSASGGSSGGTVSGASGALPATQAGGSLGVSGGGAGGRTSFAGMGPEHEHESQGGANDGGDRGFGGNLFGFGGFGSFSGFGGGFNWPGNCPLDSNFCISCMGTRDCPTGLRCSDPDHGGVCVQPCGDQLECGPEYRCDAVQRRCGRACATNFDCSDNRVCDQQQQVCVQCTEASDCERFDPELRACDEHRCVECETNFDCKDRPDRRNFCVSSRCTR